MSFISQLKKRAIRAEAEVAHLRSLLDSFWTGDVPENATTDHLVLAVAGRKRLDAKKQKAVLLTAQTTTTKEKT